MLLPPGTRALPGDGVLPQGAPITEEQGGLGSGLETETLFPPDRGCFEFTQKTWQGAYTEK